jgi:hypothetical protein
MQSVTKGIVSEETNFAPLELFKNTGKTSKSSVPVLSAGPLYFLLSTLLAALGFRISGQFLWSSVAPMLARCMAERGVVFRVAHPNSSRFSSRAKKWGFEFTLPSIVW